MLPDTCCPHYDGEFERRPAVHQLVASGEVPTTLALDDGVGAHFVGRKLHKVISARPSASAYRVARRRREAVETPIIAEGLAAVELPFVR
jgi:peptidase E